jgi:DNA invertase Pin-like site-specific DNA recombinase
MRAVLYARVSSERQAERDLSIPAQLKALRAYAATKNWSIVKEFVDAAESARTANRPEFQHMIALARKKPLQFDGILVWKLSRFARNREDSILYKSLLRKHGVQVVSLSEPVDESPAGRLLEGVIEVIDEFYSANLAQDALRGMRENASRGFCNGGTAPYGYRQERVRVGSQLKSKLALEPREAPMVKRMFDLCLNGLGAMEIAKTLNQDSIRTRGGNPWNKNVVHYMLKNEAYAGTLLFNKPKSKQVGPSAAEGLIRIENAHPAIVPHDAFLRVQVLLHDRSPQVIHPRLLTSEYLLSGLAYCGWCHRKLIGCSAKSGRFHYYACQRVLKQGRAACRGGFIPRLKLEAAVLEKLKHRVLTEANLTSLVELVNQELSQAVRETHTRREEVQSHIEDLRARLHKLYGALETGQLSLEDLAPRIKELRSQIEESESRHSSFDSNRETALRLTRVEVLSQVSDFQQLLLGGSFLERKRFLRSFIRRVVIPHDGDEGNGEVEYTLPLVPQGPGEDSTLSNFEVLSAVQVGSPLSINDHFKLVPYSSYGMTPALIPLRLSSEALHRARTPRAKNSAHTYA